MTTVIDTYVKLALFVATVVSPQLTPMTLPTAPEQHVADTGGVQQLLVAPKSPLPRQKQSSVELPPIFARIAYCESRNRQFNEDGTILRGTVNPYDVGRYQINSLQWSDEADKLKLDLYTEEGNEAMALYLYRKFGTKPWRSSQKCWERTDQARADNQ